MKDKRKIRVHSNLCKLYCVKSVKIVRCEIFSRKYPSDIEFCLMFCRVCIANFCCVWVFVLRIALAAIIADFSTNIQFASFYHLLFLWENSFDLFNLSRNWHAELSISLALFLSFSPYALLIVRLYWSRNWMICIWTSYQLFIISANADQSCRSKRFRM